MKKIIVSICIAAASVCGAADEIPSPSAVSAKLSELFLTTDPTYYKPRGYKVGKPCGEHILIHYATVSLWVNALECARAAGNTNLEARLIAAFEPYYGEKKSVMNEYRHVDLSIVGAIPLEIAILTGDERAAKLGLYYADRQWSEPKEGYDWGERWYDPIPLPERLDWWQKGYTPETRLWIDDMYMITVLQSQAFRLTGDRKYIDRAGREMRLYLERLQRADGLFNHSPHAPFAWGRGNGWMAAGMALNLKYLAPDDPNRPAILAGYRKMMAALVANQRPSGLWGQIVDDAESWDETSASAMFAYAIQEGVNNGWLAGELPDCKSVVERAYAALVGKLDEYGNISDVCVGTGWKNDRNHYMRRPRSNGDPHGQAPLLWLCLSLMSQPSQSDDATLARDVEFVTKYAPPQDAPLPLDYIVENCRLAAAARKSAPEEYSDEIYLDYVLPYSVIREGRDDWRAEFRERFLPLVAGSTNAYDAAVTLDRTIWDMINVHYDTRRDKARQSPRHSMRIGMASCTGISIILIDACRAVGIPARLVGCNWTTIPGNHSWVEVWSRGKWRVLASGEKEREDNIWFLEYAAQADASRPDKRIYASRWSPSPDGTRFWITWEFPQSVSDVPADDVTEKYK